MFRFLKRIISAPTPASSPFSFYPKALLASSARSRRVVRTEQTGEEVPSGDPGSAFGRGEKCLRMRREVPLGDAGLVPMPSMGRPDTALPVFRWHFRDEGMALYPPKVPSERVEDAMSCPRRRHLFDPKMTLCGYGNIAYCCMPKSACWASTS